MLGEIADQSCGYRIQIKAVGILGEVETHDPSRVAASLLHMREARRGPEAFNRTSWLGPDDLDYG